MRTVRKVTFYFLLVLCSLVLLGCGKKADEDKPIGEVKAEAEQMSVEKLKSVAMEYKEAIVARRGELEKVMGELKDTPITEKMGTEAKELMNEIQNLGKSVSALQERFGVYYQKLKDKGGDLSGLEI